MDATQIHSQNIPSSTPGARVVEVHNERSPGGWWGIEFQSVLVGCCEAMDSLIQMNMGRGYEKEDTVAVDKA
jgi:hypothetical protein